jgi:hypothetical protein
MNESRTKKAGLNVRSVVLLGSEGFPTLKIEVLFSVVLLYELTENNFFHARSQWKEL